MAALTSTKHREELRDISDESARQSVIKMYYYLMYTNKDTFCGNLNRNKYIRTVLAQIANIGNEVKPSISGIDISGSTFLIKNAVLTDGVVFAFSAFFRNDNPVQLQIWRPTTSGREADRNYYKLISQMRVIPSIRGAREDVRVFR